jgi:hypothetical protein
LVGNEFRRQLSFRALDLVADRIEELVLPVQCYRWNPVFGLIEEARHGLLHRYAKHLSFAFDFATLVDAELCLHGREKRLSLELRAVLDLETTHVVERLRLG